MKIISVLAAFLALAFWAAPPVSAESRSVSVSVSCTVPPLIEVSSAVAAQPARRAFEYESDRPELTLVSEGTRAGVRTNLGKNYQSTKSLRLGGRFPMHVLSITAL